MKIPAHIEVSPGLPKSCPKCGEDIEGEVDRESNALVYRSACGHWWVDFLGEQRGLKPAPADQSRRALQKRKGKPP